MPKLSKSLKLRIIDLTITKIRIQLYSAGICTCIYSAMTELMPEFTIAEKLDLYDKVMLKYVRKHKPSYVTKLHWWPLDFSGGCERIRILNEIKHAIKKEKG